MKYERLTKRDKDGKINVTLMNAYYIMQAYDRLAYRDTEKYLEIIGNIYDNPELLEK